MDDSRDPPRTNPDERVALLVLGMHRSGTSAITRVLNLLGAGLSSDLMPPLPENPQGFWESESIMRLDDGALASVDSWWHDWTPIDAERFRSDSAQAFKPRLREALERDFSGAELFAVKDPRISRLLPLWGEMLSEMGVASRCVMISRHPAEVARSLAARNGFHPLKSHLLWLRYVLDGELYSRSLPRAFTTYPALLGDWRKEAARIVEGLGLCLAPSNIEIAREIDDFLRGDLRHHTADPEDLADRPSVMRWARTANEVLVRFANEGESAEGRRTLDAVREELHDAGSSFAPVAHAEGLAHLARSADDRARIDELAARTNELELRLRNAAQQRDQQADTARRELLARDQALATAQTERVEIESALIQARAQLAEHIATVASQASALSIQSGELDKARFLAERLARIERMLGWRIIQAVYYRPEGWVKRHLNAFARKR